MTVFPFSQLPSARDRRLSATAIMRPLLAALLGLAAALLIACSDSGKGLIPASAAGPLQGDFEAVQQTAETANGDCTATEAALLKTAEDFSALPTSIDTGLRNNLRQGIANLQKRAREMCIQPSAASTLTTTTPKATTSTPTTTSTATTTTPTTPTTPTSTAPTTPGPGGGTPAPGEEEGEPEGEGDRGNGKGRGKGNGGAGGGVGAGGQEAGR
jgi:hypothetical protein